ncbi:MAG TPA: DUF308 domain-containing protein [Acidimicrobiales bacterium]|nr:DUF308 domain-containing protein [Acidimicrobiales bacterium]
MAETKGFADEDDVLVAIGRSWGWVLAFGIATLILGVLVTIHPKNSTYFVARVLAIWLLLAGAWRIIKAIADREDSGGTRWLMATLGLISILFGLLIFHHAWETVAVVGFIVGIFWVIAGVGDFYAAYVHREGGGRALLIVAGILGVGVGILALVYPGLSLTIIAFLFGLWLVLYGIIEIGVSIQLKNLAKGG